jgi:hypothetical protein
MAYGYLIISGIILIIGLVVIGFRIWCFCEIAAKAGYSRWFGLLMVVPVVDLIIIGIFANETWPILKPKEQSRTERIDKLQAELSKLVSEQGVVNEPKQ